MLIVERLMGVGREMRSFQYCLLSQYHFCNNCPLLYLVEGREHVYKGMLMSCFQTERGREGDSPSSICPCSVDFNSK